MTAPLDLAAVLRAVQRTADTVYVPAEEAPTLPATDELRKIREEHDCGCEVCSTVSTVCPASASSYAQEILRLRDLLASERAAREAAERDTERLEFLLSDAPNVMLSTDVPGLGWQGVDNREHIDAAIADAARAAQAKEESR